MEQDQFAELRAQLWRQLDQYRGKPFDLDLLRAALVQVGRPLDWRAALVIGEMLSAHGEFALAPHVVEFVGHYAKLRDRRSLLDPMVRVPSLIVAAAEQASARKAVGYIPLPSTHRLAQEINNAGVEWRNGDLLRDPPPHERYDLILCAPPLGMRVQGVHGDATYRLLVAAAELLAPDGEMVFLLGEGFNFGGQAAAARRDLARHGLAIEAIVAVPDATRETRLPLQLVFIAGGTPSDSVFVARLTAQVETEQLAHIAVDRVESATLELGRYVPRGLYTSWERFAAQVELERLFTKTPYPPRRLGDIATEVRRVELRPADEFESALNAIYLTEVRGNPTLAPTSEGAKKRGYIEITLHPERAHAEFVATWFDSPVGRLARESMLTGTTIPRLSAAAAAEMLVVLPPLERQLDVLRVETRLRTLAVKAADARSRLWANPDAALQIEESLQTEDDEQALDAWIETLPFPLASIAYRYVADALVEDKMARLLHLFEATAEFGTTLLLSAIRTDPALYEAERERLAHPDPAGIATLDRGTFGAWIRVGRTLAKTVRRLRSDPATRDAGNRLFGVHDERVALGLASKELWQVLDDARVIRNARAHGGIESEAFRRRTLERLESLLLDLRGVIGSTFSGVELVQPTEMTYRQGVFHHRVRRLVGSNPIFRLRELEAVIALDGDYLYLVDADGLATSALQILPFFRVMASPETEQNAVYFYSSRDRDGALLFVSYHFEGRPEESVSDPVLSGLLDELVPRQTPD